MNLGKILNEGLERMLHEEDKVKGTYTIRGDVIEIYHDGKKVYTATSYEDAKENGFDIDTYEKLPSSQKDVEDIK